MGDWRLEESVRVSESEMKAVLSSSSFSFDRSCALIPAAKERFAYSRHSLRNVKIWAAFAAVAAADRDLVVVMAHGRAKGRRGGKIVDSSLLSLSLPLSFSLPLRLITRSKLSFFFCAAF